MFSFLLPAGTLVGSSGSQRAGGISAWSISPPSPFINKPVSIISSLNWDLWKEVGHFIPKCQLGQREM